MLVPVKNRSDRLPSNAKFIFNDDTRQLDLMEESRSGVVDMDASIQAINDALLRGEHTVSLVVNEDAAEGPCRCHRGRNWALPSCSGRRPPISMAPALSVSRILKPRPNSSTACWSHPGETFSMGATMGDVSLENGFAEALIIYGGRTIKGVGGGVCQVSTTLFRAVFNSGFPIVERYSHAYRVSYYEHDRQRWVESAPGRFGRDGLLPAG
jgi:hypothetical protein